MKKSIIATLFAISIGGLGAQDFGVWKRVETNDQFGDPTGEWINQVMVEGFFSNSAVYMEPMTAVVNDYRDAFSIYLFEYQQLPSAVFCHDGCFGVVVVKRENGDVEVFENVFASPRGALYFDDKSRLYKLFRSASGETIKVFIKEDTFNNYGSSTYIFEVTLP